MPDIKTILQNLLNRLHDFGVSRQISKGEYMSVGVVDLSDGTAMFLFSGHKEFPFADGIV